MDRNSGETLLIQQTSKLPYSSSSHLRYFKVLCIKRSYQTCKVWVVRHQRSQKLRQAYLLGMRQTNTWVFRHHRQTNLFVWWGNSRRGKPRLKSGGISEWKTVLDWTFWVILRFLNIWCPSQTSMLANPCGLEDFRHIRILYITRLNDLFFVLKAIKAGSLPLNNYELDTHNQQGCWWSMAVLQSARPVEHAHAENTRVPMWLAWCEGKKTPPLNSIPECYYCLGPGHHNACGLHCCWRSPVHLGENFLWWIQEMYWWLLFLKLEASVTEARNQIKCYTESLFNDKPRVHLLMLVVL